MKNEFNMKNVIMYLGEREKGERERGGISSEVKTAKVLTVVVGRSRSRSRSRDAVALPHNSLYMIYLISNF